jgi:hypothetical protein
MLPPPEARLDAGYAAAPSGAGAADASSTDADEAIEPFACRIQRSGAERVRECAPSGSGAVDAPCVSSADCRPGLACVGEDSAGRCRPLCCNMPAACATGTYCAERPLRDEASSANASEPLNVPVCVPADDCSLADPFPCPVDRECKCQADLACMLVGSDGTTSCIEPGTGKAGESCPCAWGHVCSQATGTCLKLCATTAQNAECGSGKCLAATQLPVGWGVCAGPSVSDGG